MDELAEERTEIEMELEERERDRFGDSPAEILTV
jgi:hypothetical protein